MRHFQLFLKNELGTLHASDKKPPSINMLAEISSLLKLILTFLRT